MSHARRVGRSHRPRRLAPRLLPRPRDVPLGDAVRAEDLRPNSTRARVDEILAANQGLYNGFLAAGLAWSFIADAAFATQLRFFFLACVLVAGLYGAATASKKILYVQAIPAALALVVTWLARSSGRVDGGGRSGRPRRRSGPRWASRTLRSVRPGRSSTSRISYQSRTMTSAPHAGQVVVSPFAIVDVARVHVPQPLRAGDRARAASVAGGVGGTSLIL